MNDTNPTPEAATTEQPKPQLPALPNQEEQDGGFMAAWDKPAAEVVTSLDLSNDKGKEDYFKAIRKADKGGQDTVGQTLAVRNYLAHMVNLVNLETGEVNPTPRLVFILDDGSTVGTTSAAVLTAWAHVRQLYGLGPYDPVLLVQLDKVQGSGQFKYLQLKSVAKAGGPPSKAKTKQP